MNIDNIEVLWLDQHQPLSLAELEQLSGLTAGELQHLIDCETLLPLAGMESTTPLQYSAECLTLARTAARLRSDFELDANALALTLQLLKRIHELEMELFTLHAQRPG